MIVLFLVVFRDRISTGLLVGLLVSGPLFVVVGAVLAKFGYQRKTLRDLRAQTAAQRAAAAQTASQTASRAGSQAGSGRSRSRPAPTKRTSTGPGRRPAGKRRR
jgi:hypothetical protein